MSASPQPFEESDEELQIRVVRPSELGARAPRAATTAAPAAAEQAGSSEQHLAPAALPARSPVPPQAAHGGQPAAATVARAPVPPGPQPGARRGPETASPQVAPAPARHPAGAAVAARAPRRLINGSSVFSAVCLILLIAGWSAQTERYISPKRGMGYALGIIGGSLMLLLLLYSLRKRWSWLRFLGPTPSWFRAHMVLGILGPLCILYHSNFSTGATNSNVALFCMLTVAGSGLVGRYIYAHIHHGLYGRKLQLDELRARADSLHAGSGTISFLPELGARLDGAEQRLLRAGPRLALLGFTKPTIVALARAFARWRLHAYIRRALRQSARRTR